MSHTPNSNILLYCGNSGIRPDQFADGLGSFFLLKALYEALGYQADYTVQWPSSLEPYHLVFLLLPGFNGHTDQNFFNPVQLLALQTLLKKGGRLVILGENSTVAGQNIINNLLLRLPCRLSLNKTIGQHNTITKISDHRLMKDIKIINVSGYATLTTRGHTRILAADDDGKAVIAVQKLGKYANGSDVVLCGDSNILDDESINKPDNQLFAVNLLL